MSVRFDDSLPILARVVNSTLGTNALSAGVVLRDVTGRLAFFSSEKMTSQAVETLSEKLRAALGNYSRSDRVVATIDDYGAEAILKDTSTLFISVEGHVLKLLDRRLVGGDWLRTPARVAGPPPRFVFASIKGGVGRSTALSVVAADLAARGRRVLAIDLDMEAPGLGAMLLEPKELPEFGLIDALVENGFSQLDDQFLADLIAPSALADRRGRIDVIPAFGARSLKNPGEILAKVARAYIEDVRPDGTTASVLDQVSELVNYYALTKNYDAILVDARAGLHETTAAAILGLGAEVLLFGLDEPQTFQGLSALFAHLARFVPPDEQKPEWVDRITMVQGRAPTIESHGAFSEKYKLMFAQSFSAQIARSGATETSDGPVLLPAEPFNDVPWDDNVVDQDLGIGDDIDIQDTLPVLEDTRFRLFQPSMQRDLLSEAVYRSSYGALLDRIHSSYSADEDEHSK